MDGIGALLSNIVGGAVSYFGGQDQQMRTYNLQKDLMKYQNDFNKLMWDENNKYNSPEEQYQRLLKTGMSPTAAIQALTGAGNANGPVTSAGGNAPSFESGISNIGQMLSNIPLQAMQILNSKADTRQKEVTSNATESKLYFEIEQYKAQIEKINKELGLTDKQIEYQSILNKYADNKSQAEIDQIIEQRNLLVQQIDNLKEDEKKAAWENFYRTNFGIDPSSNYMNMLITASLKGDMENVFNAFEKTANTIWKKAKEYLQPVVDDVKTTFKDGIGNIRTIISDKYDNIFGPKAKELRKLKRVLNWSKFNSRINFYTGGPNAPKYINKYGKRN